MKKLVMLASVLAMTSMMSIPLANAAEDNNSAPKAVEVDNSSPKTEGKAEYKESSKTEVKGKKRHHKKKKVENTKTTEQVK